MGQHFDACQNSWTSISVVENEKKIILDLRYMFVRSYNWQNLEPLGQIFNACHISATHVSGKKNLIVEINKNVSTNS